MNASTSRLSRATKAAANAAWWTFGVTYVILLLQYAFYLYAVRARPTWFMALWGPSIDWAEVQRLWLAGMVGFKIMAFALFCGALWLTLWARRLARLGRDERAGEQARLIVGGAHPAPSL